MFAADTKVLGHLPAAMGLSDLQQQEPRFVPSLARTNAYLPSSRHSSSDSDSDYEMVPTKYMESLSLTADNESSAPVVVQTADRSMSAGTFKSTSTQIQQSLADSASLQPQSQAVCVKPKYGTRIIGLPDLFRSTDMTSKPAKEKSKKKKWRSIHAEEMGFKLTLFPRVCVQDSNDSKEDEIELHCFLSVEAEMDSVGEISGRSGLPDLSQLEGSGLDQDSKLVRRCHKHRVEKAHKQVKSKNISSVLNNRGRKTLYIHFRLYKQNPFLHCSNLFHPNLPSPPKRKGVSLDVARSASKALRAATHSHRKAPPPQNLAHALDNNNYGNELPTDIISFLISLQHREMTPEDYDMLLRLDEGVQPKTVAQDIVGSLPTDEVDSSTAGGVCSVCIEIYEVGQRRKFLPCSHVFHAECIDMWLTNSSQNCPLDGLPIGDS